MQPKALFLKELQKLHQCVNSGDAFNALEIANLVIKLLKDGHSLVSLINREYKLKISFSVPELEPPPLLLFKDTEHFWIEFLDQYLDTSLVVQKSLDGFFKTVIAKNQKFSFTVWDFIEFARNKKGGTHIKPDLKDLDDKQKYFRLQFEQVEYNQQDLIIAALRSIGKIVLRALKDLARRVLNLEEFYDKSGIECHFCIALPPIVDVGNNIYDVKQDNSDKKRNRVSLYVNESNSLILRYYDSLGNKYILNYGPVAESSPRAEGFSLAFRVCYANNKLLMAVETPTWLAAEVYRGVECNDLSPLLTSKIRTLGNFEPGYGESNFVFFAHIICEKITNYESLSLIQERLKNQAKSSIGLHFHNDAAMTM